MCGICGFFGEGNRSILDSMNQRLVHRGPDASGAIAEKNLPLHFGHRRLSIVDLGSGAQPMESACGRYVITFNGEIYNHLELREELEKLGRVFRTRNSDTETILNAYAEWGSPFVSRLCGMWAFALFDRENREIFLSRDRFGEKPLYYAVRKDTFVFASELSALTAHPAIAPEVDDRALRKLFAYGFIPAPLSILKGVQKLPAGCNLTVQCEPLSVRMDRWWEYCIEPFEGDPTAMEERWCEELRALLDQAVGRSLLADVPVSVLLSGGVDSSTIAACAARHVQAPLKTFSIGFAEDSFDESAFARMVSEHVGTEHLISTMTVDMARELAPEILSRLDEPMGDPSLIPTTYLCGIVSEHVKVALGGDGGDELFAGYDPFKALKPARLYQRLVPGPVHRGIRALFDMLPVSHANMSLDFKIKRTLKGLSWPASIRDAVWLGPLGPDELRDLFSAPVDIEDVYEEAIDIWEASDHKDPIEATLQFYTRLYLSNDILTKSDRASMMHSLEVRSPFLDKDLVDFVRRLPWQMKYNNGTTKYLLKKAVEPWLPREIIYRKKKGFGLPIGQWFKDGGLTVTSRGLPGGLSKAYVESEFAEHVKGTVDSRIFLWAVLVLNRCRATSPAI